MEVNDAKNAFDALVQRSVEQFGFTRCAQLTFARTFGATETFLLFGLRKDARGYFAATGSIGLHFCRLDSLVDGSPKNGIHINIPIHLVGRDHSFREWQFVTSSQLADVGVDLTRMIKDRILPFLEANVDLVTLRDRLVSPDPKDWYVLTSEQRIVLLAATQGVLGDTQRAIATIDEGLSSLSNALPKKRAALELLRTKLAAK